MADFNPKNLNSYDKSKLAGIIAKTKSSKTGKSVDVSSVNIYDSANLDLVKDTSAFGSLFAKTGSARGKSNNSPLSPNAGISSITRWVSDNGINSGIYSQKDLFNITLATYNRWDDRAGFRNMLNYDMNQLMYNCGYYDSGSDSSNMWSQFGIALGMQLAKGLLSNLVGALFGKTGSSDGCTCGKSHSSHGVGKTGSSDDCTFGKSHSSPGVGKTGSATTEPIATFEVESKYRDAVTIQEGEFNAGTEKIKAGQEKILEGQEDLAAAKNEKTEFLKEQTEKAQETDREKAKAAENYKLALDAYDKAKADESDFNKQIKQAEQTISEQDILIGKYDTQLTTAKNNLEAAEKKLEDANKENPQNQAKIAELKRQCALYQQQVKDAQDAKKKAEDAKKKAEEAKKNAESAKNALDIAGKKSDLDAAEAEQEKVNGRTCGGWLTNGQDDASSALDEIYAKIEAANNLIAEGEAMVAAGKAMQETAQAQANTIVEGKKGRLNYTSTTPPEKVIPESVSDVSGNNASGLPPGNWTYHKGTRTYFGSDGRTYDPENSSFAPANYRPIGVSPYNDDEFNVYYDNL